MGRVGEPCLMRRFGQTGPGGNGLNRAGQAQPKDIGPERQSGLFDKQMTEAAGGNAGQGHDVRKRYGSVDVIGGVGDHPAYPPVQRMGWAVARHSLDQVSSSFGHGRVGLPRTGGPEAGAEILDERAGRRGQRVLLEQRPPNGAPRATLGFDEDEGDQTFSLEPMRRIGRYRRHIAGDGAPVGFEPERPAEADDNLDRMVRMDVRLLSGSLRARHGVDQPQARAFPDGDACVRQNFHRESLAET